MHLFIFFDRILKQAFKFGCSWIRKIVPKKMFNESPAFSNRPCDIPELRSPWFEANIQCNCRTPSVKRTFMNVIFNRTTWFDFILLILTLIKVENVVQSKVGNSSKDTALYSISRCDCLAFVRWSSAVFFLRWRRICWSSWFQSIEKQQIKKEQKLLNKVQFFASLEIWKQSIRKDDKNPSHISKQYFLQFMIFKVWTDQAIVEDFLIMCRSGQSWNDIRKLEVGVT